MLNIFTENEIQYHTCGRITTYKMSTGRVAHAEHVHEPVISFTKRKFQTDIRDRPNLTIKWLL